MKFFCFWEEKEIEVPDNFDCYENCENYFNCECARDEEQRRNNEEFCEYEGEDDDG